MFLGHYAVALGAKRVAPSVSLGTLFAAAAFLDLLWPVLVLAGIERVAIAPGVTAFTPLDFLRSDRHRPTRARSRGPAWVNGS